MIGKEVMEVLRENKGEEVIVFYVDGQVEKAKTGVLEDVDDFKGITISCLHLPFIGYQSAIQRIMVGHGEILYENMKITPDHYIDNKEDLERVKTDCFDRG